jgi:phosphate transport system permease protein
MKRLNNKIKGGLLVGLTASSVILIIAIIVIILVVIIMQGKDRLTWEFLTSFPENGMTEGGIFPAIYGTALMVLIMTIAAVPFGTLTAIYMSEYAKE